MAVRLPRWRQPFCYVDRWLGREVQSLRITQTLEPELATDVDYLAGHAKVACSKATSFPWQTGRSATKHSGDAQQRSSS